MPNYTILLVDYEPRSIERTKRPLLEAGFKIEMATDGLAALEAFEKVHPDLVLIEAMLPKKHGFEVCHELKQTAQGKRTPILITTGVYKGRKYRTQALHMHGADEYIEKPIPDDKLLELVGKFLQSSGTSPGPSAKPVPAPTPTVKPPAVESTPARQQARRDSEAIAMAEEAAPAVSAAAPSATRARSASAPALKPAAKSAPADEPLGFGGADDAPWRAGSGSLVGDLPVDEIMARLDALLQPDGSADAAASFDAPGPPSSDAQTSPLSQSSSATQVAVADSPAEQAHDLESAADALSEADPEIIVSPAPPSPAQAASREASEETAPAAEASITSSLELTVAPGATDLEVASKAASGAADAPSTADVVRFDAGRSKKRKKAKSRSEAPSAATIEPVSAVGSPAPLLAPAHDVEPEIVPVVAETAAAIPELEEAVARRTVPLWIWGLVAAAVLVAAYFVFFSRGNESAAAPANVPNERARVLPSNPVVIPPAPAVASPVETAASPADAPTSEIDRSPAGVAAPVPLQATPPKPVREGPKRSAPPAAATGAQRVRAESATENAPAPAAEAAPADPPPAPTPEPVPAVRPGPPPADAAAEGVGLAIDPVPVQIATSLGTTTRRSVQGGDLVPLSEVDHPPLALSRTPPQYTARARMARQQGTVVLNLLVDETGRVADVRVLRSIPGSDLGEAAASAARTWTYKPASKDGVRVKVWKAEQIVFKP